MTKRQSKPQNFEHGAVILLASALIVKLIGAIFKIPLQNTIGTLGFGYFSSAYDLFLPIYSLSMAGLPIAVSRLTAEYMASERYKDARKILSVAKKAFFVTGFTGFAVMLCAIYPYAKITANNDPTELKNIAVCVLMIAPTILICCFMSAYRGYYEGMRNMYPTAVSDVIEALGKLVLGFGFAYIIMKMTGNVAYAAAGALCGIMIGTVAAAAYLHLRHKVVGDPIEEVKLAASPDSVGGKMLLKSLISIAVPIALSALASNITLLIDSVMVKWQLSNVMESNFNDIQNMYKNIIGYEASMGNVLTDKNMPTFLYGVRGEAYVLYNLIPTLTTTIGIGSVPFLATAWVKKDKMAVKKNIDTILRTTSLIAFPAGLGLAAISGPIMSLLYEGVASETLGSQLLKVLGVASILAAISVPMNNMLQAVGKMFVPVRNIAIGASLKIIVNLLLVGRPELNIKGAPVGTTVCYLYIFIANLYSLVKHTGIKPDYLSIFIKPVICAFFSSGAAYGVLKLCEYKGFGNLMTVAFSICAAAIVYVFMIFALKTLNREDIEGFPMGKKIAKILVKLRFIR